MTSCEPPRRAALARRRFLAVTAALGLALVAVVATRGGATNVPRRPVLATRGGEPSRPALARRQPSNPGGVGQRIMASDKYWGDLGRSLFAWTVGPAVIIALLVRGRCREPRRRKGLPPVAHATYGSAPRAKAVVAEDDPDDDARADLPAARPVHRNPFDSPTRPPPPSQFFNGPTQARVIL